MPNHCFQTLTVTGPIEDVTRFHNKVTAVSDEDNTGIARSYIPFPKELHGDDIRDKDGNLIGRAFSDEGYAWTLNNWGTKWGDYDADVISPPSGEGNDGHAYYQFTSAWSPLDEGIRRISEMEPTLLFFLSYKEEANDYIGSVAYRAGEELGRRDINDGHRFPEMPEDDDWDSYYEALDNLVMECEDAVSEAIAQKEMA